MKLPTKLFILFQILDIALTFFALRFNLGYEYNPIGFTVTTILVKFVVILFISYILEKINFGKLSWVLPIGMYLVVLWNICIIITEILFRLELV